MAHESKFACVKIMVYIAEFVFVIVVGSVRSKLKEKDEFRGREKVQLYYEHGMYEY